MGVPVDYYETLQVSPNAEAEVIAAAYRRLARKYHPDVYKGADATNRMRYLNAAFEVLNDPVRRAVYDRTRRDRSGSSAQYSHDASDGSSEEHNCSKWCRARRRRRE